MQQKIDVTVPFIAIRTDVKGSEYDRTMGEYLCNPLSEDLLDVSVSIGGFFSTDESGVVTSAENIKRLPTPIAAGTAHRFGLSSQDEYDEFSCSWIVRYRTATSGSVKVEFATSKSLRDTQLFADVPILGGPGQVVPLSIMH